MRRSQTRAPARRRGMTVAASQLLEFTITVGGVFAVFFGFVFGLLWIWNH